MAYLAVKARGQAEESVGKGTDAWNPVLEVFSQCAPFGGGVSDLNFETG